MLKDLNDIRFCHYVSFAFTQLPNIHFQAFNSGMAYHLNRLENKKS